MTARCTDRALDDLLVSEEIMRDPYPIYRRLRETAPVFWSERWNSWVVSRFDDVSESLKEKELLSNENRQGLLFSSLSPEGLRVLAPLRHYFAQKDVIGSDPPDHVRMRALVQKAFAPATIASLEGRIRALAQGMLADALKKGGEFDLVEEIAHPLPVILIAELLGAPPEDRPHFKRWAADILSFQGTGTAELEVALVSQTALLELFDYMNRLIDRRRSEPRDDVITALAFAEVDGRGFSRDELLATCNTLLTAGHETTTNLIANLAHLLLTHPEQWEWVRGHREFVAPAVEEAARFEAPKQRNFRRVKKSHTFRGAPFEENQMVFQLIGSANRDPARNEDPDRFDIRRAKIEHLTFGQGIHFCLGAPLARLEARVVLETLLDTVPRMRFRPESLRWQTRVQLRGPARLGVEAG